MAFLALSSCSFVGPFPGTENVSEPSLSAAPPETVSCATPRLSPVVPSSEEAPPEEAPPPPGAPSPPGPPLSPGFPSPSPPGILITGVFSERASSFLIPRIHSLSQPVSLTTLSRSTRLSLKYWSTNSGISCSVTSSK